ncbi:MAG: IS3 family transposase [Acidobacteriota bacterium]|jgi:transposase InsO family protein
MSRAASPGTGLVYGVARVCAIWGVPRSSFYAEQQRKVADPSKPAARRRGPKPKISDADLLAAIRADLEASPFEGEGYRKVWARLRVQQGIRVSRTRVRVLMRDNNLLSPHRARRRDGRTHDGTIITDAPNVMWGTDGVRVFTLEDGWGWIFPAVDHWNAECVGWHVCKKGDRFAALEPIKMGLARLYGSTSAGAARGLSLRMDHGTQYLSDHFTNQIKFWGIQPSYSFVAEPQGNGVVERFNRTLKEQVIHGRVYRNLDELRNAVRQFAHRYNAQWLVEKNGFLSPNQAREKWNAARSVRPAA